MMPSPHGERASSATIRGYGQPRWMARARRVMAAQSGRCSGGLESGALAAPTLQPDLMRRPVLPGRLTDVDYLGTTVLEFADAGPVPTPLTALTKNLTNRFGVVKVNVTERAVAPASARIGAPTATAPPPFVLITWANTW